MSLIVVPESASTLRSVRKRERRALVGLILVLAPLFTACTVTEPTPPEPTGLVTYPLPEDWMGMAGLKVGTLAFVDNCVRFDDGAIPVFPDKVTQGEGGDAVENSEHWIDKKHIEYWRACIDNSYPALDLSSRVTMIPDRIRKLME